MRSAISGGRPILDLSDGRLTVSRGHLSPAELKALQAVDESNKENRCNLLNHVGEYLANSSVGRSLFKPNVFHLWPSPAGCIAGALNQFDCNPHMGIIRVPACSVEDCSMAWVSRRDLVYIQDGYSHQWLWQGTLELTRVVDWKREPTGVRLTMYYGHNLDRNIDKLHLRYNLVMLRLPRALLGINARKAWTNHVLCATPLMPERSSAESPFRKYCLDRWKEVAVDHLDWLSQDRQVHDFTREALMDPSFPWDDSFGKIWEHLHQRKAELAAKQAFSRSWTMAGLDVQAYCVDCKAWVSREDAKRWNHEETSEDDASGVIVYGCWVVKAGFFDGFSDPDKDELTSGNENLFKEYGRDVALFGGHHIGSPTICSKKKRKTAWRFNACLNCWELLSEQQPIVVQWKKTCLATTATNAGTHFPSRAERYDSSHHDILATYENLGWVLVSGDMSFDTVIEKKVFKHHSVLGWTDHPVMRRGATGYALRTGEISGITAIDIDDVRLDHNRRLSELCEEAGAIKQSTKKGYHYLFQYTPLLRTRTGSGGVCLDVRNDTGLLYCEPSSYRLNATQVFRYSWQNLPLDPARIPVCPQEVIETVCRILGDGVPSTVPPV